MFNPEKCQVIIKGRRKKKVLTKQEEVEMLDMLYSPNDEVFMLDELDYDPIPEIMPNNRRKPNE